MTRPTNLPDWATNTNYSVGPYPGQPNKVQPPAGVVSEGFNPQSPLPAEWVNGNFNNHGSWIRANNPAFGDGSDGTVSVSTTVTLTRAMFYDTLTVTTGGTLVTAGFPVFVRNILTLNNTGKITANGADGQSGSGGGGAATGSMLGGATGGAPGAAAGASGSNIAADGLGGAGGNGGTGSGGAPGFGGSVTALLGVRGTPRSMQSPPGFVFGLNAGTATLTGFRGGAGGGGGSGDGSFGFGGGAGGGGVLYLMAREIVFTGGATATALQAAGGKGSDGGGANRGAGGGGGGGVAIIGWSFRDTSITFSAAVNAPGGLKGTDGAGVGVMAANGSSGTMIELPLY